MKIRIYKVWQGERNLSQTKHFKNCHITQFDTNMKVNSRENVVNYIITLLSGLNLKSSCNHKRNWKIRSAKVCLNKFNDSLNDIYKIT